MKAAAALIAWHDTSAVLSVDVSDDVMSSGGYKLATASVDGSVRLWEVKLDNESVWGVNIKYLSTLHGHNSGVNVVRFSRSSLLASAGDDSNIYIWGISDLHGFGGCEGFEGIESQEECEKWQVKKVLRGHTADVYDLEWSRDCSTIVSGSIDNSIMIWDVERSKVVQVIKSHDKFVQGVAIDPFSVFIVSIGCDKTLFSFKRSRQKRKAKSSSFKFKRHETIKRIQVDTESGPVEISFYDDNNPIYFRRLSWSPDGQFLVVPSGIVVSGEGEVSTASAGLLFERSNLTEPLSILSGFKEPTVASAFCPVPFRRKGEKSCRWVFALCSTTTVSVYDTKQEYPICIVNGLHCSQITDVRWTPSGRCLVVSSTDGYCSFVTFEEGELGEVISMPALEDVVVDFERHVNETPPIGRKTLDPPATAPELSRATQIMGEVPKVTERRNSIEPKVLFSKEKQSSGLNNSRRRIVPSLLVPEEGESL